MLVQCDALHITEELPTFYELRAEWHAASKKLDEARADWQADRDDCEKWAAFMAAVDFNIAAWDAYMEGWDRSKVPHFLP